MSEEQSNNKEIVYKCPHCLNNTNKTDLGFVYCVYYPCSFSGTKDEFEIVSGLQEDSIDDSFPDETICLISKNSVGDIIPNLEGYKRKQEKIMEAILFLRNSDNDISDGIIDFMLRSSLEAMQL